MDRAKAAGQLANGYAEVYTTLAALAAVCALAALILRPPLQPQRS
jgi:hypothetical protein